MVSFDKKHVRTSSFHLHDERRLFDFSNKNKGIINFKGNMLFTHFSEIGAPDMAGDMNVGNSYTPPQNQDS